MSLSFVVGKIIFRNTFFHISHKHTCIFLNCYHELDQGIYQGPVISNTCINTGTSINVLYMYICFTHMLAVTLLVFTKCHPNKYSELADSFSKTIFPKIPVFPEFWYTPDSQHSARSALRTMLHEILFSRVRKIKRRASQIALSSAAPAAPKDISDFPIKSSKIYE